MKQSLCLWWSSSAPPGMVSVVGTRKLLVVGLSHHALYIEFSVLLIAQHAALPKNSCWCLLSRGPGKQFGKPEYGERTSPYNLQCNPQIFTILSENGVDVTDVSLPWLSIFLSSLQSQHPGLIFPKPLFIHTEGLDFFEECIPIWLSLPCLELDFSHPKSITSSRCKAIIPLVPGSRQN